MKIAKYKTSLFFTAAILLAVVLIWLTFYTFVEFSGFAAAFGKALLGIGIFFLIDRFVFHRVDTYTEIFIKKNQPYATVLLGISIIIAACIATG